MSSFFFYSSSRHLFFLFVFMMLATEMRALPLHQLCWIIATRLLQWHAKGKWKINSTHNRIFRMDSTQSMWKDIACDCQMEFPIFRAQNFFDESCVCVCGTWFLSIYHVLGRMMVWLETAFIWKVDRISIWLPNNGAAETESMTLLLFASHL